MSKYIEADTLIESICHTADLGGWIGDTLRNIKRLAVRYINSTPSIDIVRCRECKHWSQAPKTDKGWCDRLDGLLDPTWYCADGERKEDE